MGQSACQEQYPKYRQDGLGQLPQAGPAKCGQGVAIGGQPGLAELLPGKRFEKRDDRPAHRQQYNQADGEKCRRGKVLAVDDLALLAGLLPAMRGGVL